MCSMITKYRQNSRLFERVTTLFGAEGEEEKAKVMEIGRRRSKTSFLIMASNQFSFLMIRPAISFSSILCTLSLSGICLIFFAIADHVVTEKVTRRKVEYMERRRGEGTRREGKRRAEKTGEGR